MSNERRVVLVCAPAGCDFKGAVARIGELLGTQHAPANIVVKDVEDVLCKGVAERGELQGRVVSQQRPITMHEVTYNLPRPKVIDLWQQALADTIRSLSESSAQIRLIACHLNLYSARRREFYSPLDVGQLLAAGVSHVMLLIDDIFDMYARLSTPGHIYAEGEGVERYIKQNLEQQPRHGAPRFSPHSCRELELEWKTRTLTSLLAWRHSEMMVAESLAKQLRAAYTVFGTKQLAAAATCWLTSHPPLAVYLSHPISRPRRTRRAGKPWPAVVGEFNHLQGWFLEHSVIAVMPTAIDEYRLRPGPGGGELTSPLPILDERWPLPGEEEGALLYSSATGPEHTNLLMEEEHADDPCWTSLLRGFEAAIMAEIPFRDHHLVVANPNVLIYRPLYEEGSMSAGVSAEVDHWADLATQEPHRRAVFIHFREDLDCALRKARGEYEDRVLAKLQMVLERDLGFEAERARRHARSIREGNPPQLLDAGIDIDAREGARLHEQAHLDALGELLSAGMLTNEKVAIWVVDNLATLGSQLAAIAAFFRGETEPPASWRDECPPVVGV